MEILKLLNYIQRKLLQIQIKLHFLEHWLIYLDFVHFKEASKVGYFYVARTPITQFYLHETCKLGQCPLRKYAITTFSYSVFVKSTNKYDFGTYHMSRRLRFPTI